MSHFIKVSLYFFASALVAIGFGFGASFAPGALIPGVVVAALVSLAAVCGGIFITMQSRFRFQLMQTGRLVQYGSFWLCGALALKLAGFLLPGVLAVSSASLAAFVSMVICFTAATLTGQIPWKGRTWLPVRMKNDRK